VPHQYYSSHFYRFKCLFLKLPILISSGVNGYCFHKTCFVRICSRSFINNTYADEICVKKVDRLAQFIWVLKIADFGKKIFFLVNKKGPFSGKKIDAHIYFMNCFYTLYLVFKKGSKEVTMSTMC